MCIFLIPSYNLAITGGHCPGVSKDTVFSNIPCMIAWPMSNVTWRMGSPHLRSKNWDTYCKLGLGAGIALLGAGIAN